MNVFQRTGFFALFILFFLFALPVFADNPKTGTVEEALLKHSGENAEKKEEETAANNDVQQEEEIQFAEPPSLFSLFVRLIVALLIVLGIIYVLLRIVNKRSRSFQRHRMLENIGGIPLGTNRSIQIVKVGERLLVLGVGDSIQLLKEINDKEEIRAILNETVEEPMIKQIEPPLDKLGQVFMNRKKNVQNIQHQVEFRELLNEQLQDVSKSQRKIHEAMKEHKNE